MGSMKHVWNQSLIPANNKVPSHKTAKVAVMTDKTESKELFHRVQKEHKTWWRKLAQDPSRFRLTEEKKIRNLDSVDIEAQFPFGNITVETIIYHHDPRKLFTQVENGKIEIADMQMVEHITSLDWGCLALLCDAHKSENLDEVHVHSKLSPYKVAFYIAKPESVSSTEGEDLNRFVLYLNNMLRTKGINTILTSAKEIIDICLVPFIVKVDETSLKNGIIHVTSRSTTLSESIHITDLVKFIIMRC
ncbi:hypothetical protein KM043_017133 [Ampulex compressa]|nr:hypothetical protein KM043_017133 [Ampulex compressa]